MKRMIRMSLVLLFVGSLVWAYPLEQSDIGSIGMASAGVALSLSPASFFANPALLYIREGSESSLYVSGSYEDSVVVSNFQDRLPNPFLENPNSGFCISFSGSNLALTIQNQSSLLDRIDRANSTQYSGTKKTLFQLDWAIGKAPFSIGLNVKALAVSERSPIEIRSDHVVTDYLVETLIGRYEPVESESLVQAGFGVLLDYDWFKMGFASNTFAYAQGDDPIQISAGELFKTLAWGFSLSTPTYDDNNQLHLLKLQSALDLYNIGSTENRELRFGLDVKVQLLPTWSVSFKTGYKEVKPTPTDIFKFNPGNGIHTLGLSLQLDSFLFDLACKIPLAWYWGGNDDSSSVGILLALSFAI